MRTVISQSAVLPAPAESLFAMYTDAGFTHLALEHVANAELTPDLFHIDGLGFVGEARIAGDNKQPSDTAGRSAHRAKRAKSSVV